MRCPQRRRFNGLNLKSFIYFFLRPKDREAGFRGRSWDRRMSAPLHTVVRGQLLLDMEGAG